MLDVGFSELKDAFNAHSRNAGSEGGSPSHYLLLFYAVECGLKATYLCRQPPQLCKMSQVFEQDEKMKDHPHDLHYLVIQLRLPAEITKTNSDFRLKDKSARKVEEAHQAWRYGIKMFPEDQQKLIEWLKNIQQWIKENRYQ